MVLGKFPELTLENARKKALKAKAKIIDGEHPLAEKNKLRGEITFKDLCHEYMERYSKVHKKSWQYDEREIRKFLNHFQRRRISTITQQDVRTLHEKIGRENGRYQANRILERVRAIYNKAIEWGWDGKNPTSGIKKFKEKARDRFIQPHELPLIFEALSIEENETARDFILMSMVTGARKSNLLAMRWEEISWDRNEWRIPDTKNGEPLTIPLIQHAMEILGERRQISKTKWVFQSDRTEGHFADPKKSWDRIRHRATLDYWRQTPSLDQLIKQVESNIKQKDNYPCTVRRLYDSVRKEAENCGVKLPNGLMDLRIHDVRRTLGSYQAITGASLQIIGKSLGHKSPQSTEIYARLHLDPVRASIELASKTMFEIGGFTDDRRTR